MVQASPLSNRRHPQAAPYRALRQLLIDARHEAALTQVELANLLGRPQSFISKVENGERYLDAVELVAICMVLDCDLDLFSKAVRVSFSE